MREFLGSSLIIAQTEDGERPNIEEMDGPVLLSLGMERLNPYRLLLVPSCGGESCVYPGALAAAVILLS
jgi:hypothetical protein